jgi:hypothetical protein
VDENEDDENMASNGEGKIVNAMKKENNQIRKNGALDSNNSLVASSYADAKLFQEFNTQST